MFTNENKITVDLMADSIYCIYKTHLPFLDYYHDRVMNPDPFYSEFGCGF